MKIAIIGSAQLRDMMRDYRNDMKAEGHKVRMPCLDDDKDSALEIIEQNRANIIWADKVIVFWDGRSPGTKGDMYMAMALKKPMWFGYLEEKTERQGFVDYVRREGKR